MSETKFTAAPWHVVEYGDGDSLVIHHNDTDRVCFMATHGGSQKSWEAIQANANLIAAAPALYDAALAAKELLKPDLDEPERTVFWKLVDALKLARGEQP